MSDKPIFVQGVVHVSIALSNSRSACLSIGLDFLKIATWRIDWSARPCFNFFQPFLFLSLWTCNYWQCCIAKNKLANVDRHYTSILNMLDPLMASKELSAKRNNYFFDDTKTDKKNMKSDR